MGTHLFPVLFGDVIGLNPEGQFWLRSVMPRYVGHPHPVSCAVTPSPGHITIFSIQFQHSESSSACPDGELCYRDWQETTRLRNDPSGGWLS